MRICYAAAPSDTVLSGGVGSGNISATNPGPMRCCILVPCGDIHSGAALDSARLIQYDPGELESNLGFFARHSF